MSSQQLMRVVYQNIGFMLAISVTVLFVSMASQEIASGLLWLILLSVIVMNANKFNKLLINAFII